jgi:DNA-binding NarL/FixJ family response regulator
MAALLARLAAAQKAERGAARGVPLGCLAQVLRAFGEKDAAPRAGRDAASAVPGLVEQLTAREREILVPLAAGTPNPRIAEELVVSLDTVKKARQPPAGQARRGQPHRGRHPGPPARPDPLA